MWKRFLAMTAALSTSCMVGPHYQEPKHVIAKHWLTKNKSVSQRPAQDANWWHVLGDDNLLALIQKGYHNNLTLQSAAVHVLQTRAQLAQATGNLLPQQQAVSGLYQYYRLGGNYLESVLPSSFSTTNLGMMANWELDFWGKYRRAILANDATFLSSFAAYDQALVTMVSDIASIYTSIRTTQALIVVLQENINMQRMSLQLAQSRYNAGQISLQDVAQAKTELAQTQSQLPPLVTQLQQQKDALGVLLGTSPDKVDAELSNKHGIPIAPDRIAVGIPKETLARRPDVHEARLNAIAQSELIGATKANLYPSLALAGNFVFSANTISGQTLGTMFDWGSRNITAGPTLNWPVLNYGQITNAVRAQDAAFQQALLKYMNLVLQAEKEVQDNITRYIEAKKAERLLLKASKSAVLATNLVIIRYREGEVDYTTVLYAQQQQLKVQSSLVQAQGEVPQAVIALYRALGGGWQLRHGDDILPAKIKQDMAKRTNWGKLLQQKNHQPPTDQVQRSKQLYLPSW